MAWPPDNAGSGQSGDSPLDRTNPFQPSDSPEEAPQPSRTPSHDPSIEHEPHLAGQAFAAGESDQQADLRWAVDADLSDADAIEHTVWDEPALSADLSGRPGADQASYATWLEEQIARTTSAETWRTTLLVALAAGPWGVLGALISQVSTGGIGFSGVLAAAILAPVTEEITKVATALWVVEKRPFRFGSATQIMLCAAAGGLAFATIENLLYLVLYNPGGGAGYVVWRLVVCTSLHLVCSTIAGVGLATIWKDAISRRRRPELALGMPWFAAAMILHGLYNTAVTLAEVAGVLTFS
ncbi:MAG: PrsW family glutamic-type intramembrane protease [Planctomycetota bacterium]